MDYRDDDYDYDYHNEYRGDYRNESRNDYRAGRGGRRRYRTEDDDYMEELSDCMRKGLCASKDYERLAEMTDNRDDKSKLMKMAQREKEHYKTTREILDKYM